MNYNTVSNNEYELNFKSFNSIFDKKWESFFSENLFTFYIPPITGDIIELFDLLNEKDEVDIMFRNEFFSLFSTQYIRIIERIHADKRCILKVEPFLFVQ
ncbi:hypothetical protein [Chryseobacterium sp. 5_R23647]|uniref:hypothetical protein n=1 Tax=Chryseobacterium sp. 5_R23647 TaxID=2258964 RepID=UPI000E2786CE|nr:hypothetical protein [Chryseobacterium sp. 5_R23647]REC40489.1 hypothetical protein DRF69_18520 [Chryseobacterium sp. 5_R23647]